MRILKNLFIFIVLIAIIAGSFWISFTMGKNILTPVKKITTIDKIMPQGNVLDDINKITFEVEQISLEVNSNKQSVVETVESAKPDEDFMKPKISHKRGSTVQETVAVVTEQPKSFAYRIQNGLFASKTNARNLVSSLKTQGYDAQSEISGKYTKVFILAETLSEANKIAKKLRSKGFEAVVRRK